MVDELHAGSETGGPTGTGGPTRTGGPTGADASGGADGTAEPGGAAGGGSFEPGGGTTEDAGGPVPEGRTPPRSAGPVPDGTSGERTGTPTAPGLEKGIGRQPEQPTFSDRIAAMRGVDPDEHYEPDALTLLGDVIQRPTKAFAYLGTHRAERVGLGIVVYLLAQLPWYLTGTFVEIETSFGGLLRRGITTVIGFIVGTFILHLIARMLGGQNRFSKLLQAFGISSLPGLLVAPILLLRPQWGGGASAVSGIWGFVLGVIAVREVYKFSTGRAVAAMLLPALVAVGFVVFMLVLAGVFGASLLPELMEMF